MPLNEQSGNGLMTLMNLRNKPGSSGQIPQLSPDDQYYDAMVPEEDLYAAQDEIGARGAARGSAYAIPSREELRKSGRAIVRRDLEPTLIKERGAMGRAEIEAQGQRDALLRFLVGEQNKMERQTAGDQAAYERAQMTQGAQTGRSEASQKALSQRAANRDAAMAARSSAALNVKQAGDLEKQVKEAGILDSLKDLFGFGPLSGKRAQAEQLRQQATAGLATQPLPGDEEDEGIDVSPEEWAAFQAFRQRGGQ